MPKTLEIDPRPIWRLFNDFLNWLAVDTDRITSEASALGPWGLAETNGVKHEWIDVKTGTVIDDDPYKSQIWNGWKFKRVVYVDGKARGWAWSWRKPGADWKRTIIIGVKLNGRQALTVRWHHSDAASAAGTLGENAGQSVKDEWGPA